MIRKFGRLQPASLADHSSILFAGENPQRFAGLLTALRRKYAPTNPVEEDLVFELARIRWAQRRLRFAEGADPEMLHRQSLQLRQMYARTLANLTRVRIELSGSAKSGKTNPRVICHQQFNPER